MTDNNQKVVVVDLNNRKLKMKCSDHQTIGGLKTALQDEYSIPRDDQILFVDGVPDLYDLEDEVLLSNLGTKLISLRLSAHHQSLVSPRIVLPNKATYQTIHHKLSKVKEVKADVNEYMKKWGMDVGGPQNILLRSGDDFWQDEDNLFKLGVQNDTELECLIIDPNQPPPTLN